MITLPIKNWAEDDRPREKMMLKGNAALSNAELLAILINNGTRNSSALDLAKSLLQAVNNNLVTLGKMSIRDITKLKIKGLGEAKAITILAALELGQRRDTAQNKKEAVTKTDDVAAFLKSKFQYLRHEVFAVVFLNQANRILHFEIISEGGITGTISDPRIILKKAIEQDAVSIILCHNHPSGNLKPSMADKELTRKISAAAKFFDIKVLDHIIVSEEGYFSFVNEGLI